VVGDDGVPLLVHNCWTYKNFKINAKGEKQALFGSECCAPFITYVDQDEAAEEIDSAIMGEPAHAVNIKKARERGGSWLVLAKFDHLFLFHQNVQLGCISRTEPWVDNPGNLDSLFEKIRYIHHHLPGWMQPRIKARYMHLENLDTHSVITGESTNAEVGRGGRKTAYMIDEAAAIQNADSVENALSQNTPAQIWVSTSLGPGTTFYRREHEKRGQMVYMPWFRDPEKAQGAHQVHDELGRVRWTSPWYELQCRTMSRKAVAQEIDMEDGLAGDQFFDPQEIERHRLDHQQKPRHQGDLIPKGPFTPEARIRAIREYDGAKWLWQAGANRGSWRLWFELERGRPPQEWSYLLACDVGNGSGGSNSVCSVMALETNRIVAKFWDAHVSPEDFALKVCEAACWFMGLLCPPFLIWENNGPGGIFGRKVLSTGYPHYYCQRQVERVDQDRTDRYGWHSDSRGHSKAVALGLYRDALATDTLINPCQESLDEALDYIYDKNGGLIPAKRREEPAGGRDLHGDHVIADALCCVARDELPTQRARKIKAPPGTPAWFLEQHAKRDAEDDPWRD